MVDAIVSFAVQRLGDFLIREADVLFGVKKEVVWLQKELRLMRSFLKDAEEKQDGDERIRIWVSEIQDIAYDTEDVIEAFIFKVKGPSRTSKRGMSCNSLTNCFGISTKADLYGIGTDIKDIKSRVLEVSRQRETYGINIGGNVQEGTSSGAGILRDLRLTTSYADEEYVVGLEDDAKILGGKLFRGEPQRIAMSILGMGGLGKTTLARKLYNNNSTKFNRHAWVCVSQEWKIRELLEKLIKSFKRRLTKEELEMLDKMKDYDMELYLRDLLEGCRYLVVIDDMWQKEAWESLRRALPDQKNGSRIIITTRKVDVAEISGQPEYVHKLQLLRPDESWQLFCKKAFQNNGGFCPPAMEKLGKEMTAKCGGLPLAIVVLGGLLSTKEFHEWHAVKEHIWRELKNDSIYIAPLLTLSYKDLPHELRSCFLYLGIFPEDFEIDMERLIQLWIAEELITQEEGLDLEEVAENYIEQLSRRSLIQVVKKRNWRTRSCLLHDLLRDLAVNKAKELNFLHYSNETINSAPSTMASSHRRIALSSRCKSYMSLDPRSLQRVRTLSILNNKFLSNHDDLNDTFLETRMLMKLLYPRFRLLRVLDLEGVLGVDGEREKILHEAIGELIHLRYLGLNRTDIGSLPESIGNLQALQTLNLWKSNNQKMMLPTNLCKLKQLRFVGGSFATEKGGQLMTHVLFEELTNLRFLQTVNIEGWLRQQEGNEFCLNAFAKLHNLKVLEVEFGGEYMVSVQPLLKCSNLVELVIDGGIKNLPEDMHKFLPNLKYFTLRNSKLEQDPMPVLEMLPNLLVLGLNDVRVNMMTCTAKGFPHLQVLTLGKLLPDTRLHVEEGAMPDLRALTTMASSIKDTLPERLRSLPDKEFLNWDSWAFFWHLIELTIRGGIKNLPEEMPKFLPNLKCLHLSWSNLEQDPMPALEILPNLPVLLLNEVIVGENIMICTTTGFPQLEFLSLSANFDSSIKLQVEEGAMPRLRAISMDDEILKGTLPERLSSLPGRDCLNCDWESDLERDL